MKANSLTPECAAERLKKSIVFNLKCSNQLFISINLIKLDVDLHMHTKKQLMLEIALLPNKKAIFLPLPRQ